MMRLRHGKRLRFCLSLCAAVNGVPEPQGREEGLGDAHPERLQSVVDGAEDGRRGRVDSRFADPFTLWVVSQLERWNDGVAFPVRSPSMGASSARLLARQ